MNDNVKSIDQAKEKAGEAAEKARAAVSETVGVARERVQELASDVTKKAQQVTGQLKKEADRAGEVAREKYGAAKQRLGEGYTQVRKDMDHLIEDVNEYVRDNPGRSVLIAAGIGFLVGMLLRGHGRRD